MSEEKSIRNVLIIAGIILVVGFALVFYFNGRRETAVPDGCSVVLRVKAEKQQYEVLYGDGKAYVLNNDRIIKEYDTNEGVDGDLIEIDYSCKAVDTTKSLTAISDGVYESNIKSSSSYVVSLINDGWRMELEASTAKHVEIVLEKDGKYLRIVATRDLLIIGNPKEYEFKSYTDYLA